jgi:hypothetical protein
MKSLLQKLPLSFEERGTQGVRWRMKKEGITGVNIIGL